MSLLPMNDPDFEIALQLSIELAKIVDDDMKEAAKNPNGPKRLRFTSGPDYGDGCYNIAGNADFRAMADRIIKFVRKHDARAFSEATE